jgi:dTMP kinase
MIPNSGPGKLIVLEGLDGAGTTSQTRLLADTLRTKNIRVWTTREPSEGPVGAQIRAVLARRLSMGKNTLAALFTSDRLDHLYSAGGVKERLEQNEWVIMDRYYLSSFAYQALNMDEDEKRWLLWMHQHCIQPDLTIFVDVQAETSMARIAVNRGFHFELFETQDKLIAIREQYLKAITGLRKSGEVIHVIPGEPPSKTVHKNIWKRVETRFLDGSLLSSAEELKLLARRDLHIIRQDAEEKLDLTYQGIKHVEPSENPANPGQGNAGGSYVLEFLDGNAIEYHVAAFLDKNRAHITSIRALAGAKGTDTVKMLQSICNSAIGKKFNQPQLIKEEK